MRFVIICYKKIAMHHHCCLETNGRSNSLWNSVVLSIAITGLIDKIFYKALNRLFWSYLGFDLDVFQNIFIHFFYQNGQFKMLRYQWNFSSLSNVSEWFAPPLNARIFNDILDDAMQVCQFMLTVIEANKTIPQYDFVKCSYYFWTFCWVFLSYIHCLN